MQLVFISMQYISTQLLHAICKNTIFMSGPLSNVMFMAASALSKEIKERVEKQVTHSHIIVMIGDGVFQLILLVTVVFFFSLQ